MEALLSDYEESIQNAEREAEGCIEEHVKLKGLMKFEKSLFKAGYKAGYLSASGETIELDLDT